MICIKCGAEVPDDRLVCDCFQVEADTEAQRISISRFMSDDGSLFLTHSGDHLLPASKNSLTLCRLKVRSSGTFKRFKNPEVDSIRRAQLQKPWSDRVCKECMAVLTQMAAEALSQSANAGKEQNVHDSRLERQQLKTTIESLVD